MVYRQGLARGAEVCRRGTHEWRPLVTTPELRTALVGRSSWPDIEVTEVTRVRYPALPPMRPIQDSALTEPLPTRTLPEPPPHAFHDSHSELPVAVTSVPPPSPVVHARSSELSLVAVLSFAATLGAALLAQHASHWTEVRANIDAARSVTATAPARPTLGASVQPSVWSSDLGSGAPVVRLHDLPLERERAGSSYAAASSERAERAERVERAAAAAPAPAPAVPFKGTGRAAPAANSAPSGRTQLARAMAQAARAAQSCGDGPVHTQVVATFLPSGVPSGVHFGSAPPPAALRSCVLGAVARSRVSPFEGEPVTVSKTLSW